MQYPCQELQDSAASLELESYNSDAQKTFETVSQVLTGSTHSGLVDDIGKALNKYDFDLAKSKTYELRNMLKDKMGVE